MSTLLDTNIVVAFLAGDQDVKASLGAASISISVVSLGELDYGAKKSARSQANLQRLQGFLDVVNVIPVDVLTARLFGDIKIALHRKGRPIPDNDIWIASNALQYDLALVTRDGHFSHIDGLRIET